MTFYVGQKVVCVDVRNFSWTKEWVAAGEIYTIASIDRIQRANFGFFAGVPCQVFELVGIDKPNGFLSVRFRPAVEDRKSVSFTTGAPDGSEQWDNRRKVHERT